MPEIDPDRVAAGKKLRCPHCDETALAETLSGPTSLRRWKVFCCYCDALPVHVEKDLQTGVARIVPASEVRARASGEKKSRRAARKKVPTSEEPQTRGARLGAFPDPKPVAAFPPCRCCGGVSYNRGQRLCARSYFRWIACKRPDVALFVELGCPTATAWQKLGQQAADESEAV